MSWLRLDDGYMSHEKILQLRDGEFRLWHAALAECNKQANDGIFPKATLRVLYGHLERPKTGLACTLALVKVGLWYDLGSHIRIHDYLEYQISSDQRKRLNKAAADRMQRHREKKISRLSKTADAQRYGVTDTVTDGVTNAVTSPVVTPEVRTVFAHPNPTQPNPTRRIHKENTVSGQVQAAPLPDLPGTVSQPGFALQLADSAKTKPARSQGAKQAKQVTNGAKIFQAYLEAFGSVYRNASGEPVTPLRDSRTNTHFARIAVMAIEGRSPEISEDQAIEEASEVARRYVHHSDAMYVRAQHSPGLLEMHWHKLLTETRTGRQVTSRSAREKERIGGNSLLQMAAQMTADEQRKRDAIEVDDK
jgi:hypothetical protein